MLFYYSEKMKSKKNGFTLIELLVVIGIIAILLGMLFSSAVQIRAQTLSLSCKMNMHQLSKGFYLYSLDYDGFLPHSDRDSDTGRNYCWFDVLDQYLLVSNLHAVKQCPQWSGYQVNKSTTDEHSIKMNGGLCSKDRPPQTKEDMNRNNWYWPNKWRIQNKSQVVLLLDGRMDFPWNRYTDTHSAKPYEDVANRHLGGANLLFVDGSSAYVKRGKKEKFADIGWQGTNGFIWQPWKK